MAGWPQYTDKGFNSKSFEKHLILENNTQNYKTVFTRQNKTTNFKHIVFINVQLILKQLEFSLVQKSNGKGCRLQYEQSSSFCTT